MLEKEISVIKEKIDIYNEIYKLIGLEIAKRISKEEVNEYNLNNLTYSKYLELPEKYKKYFKIILEKVLNLENDSKFSKLITKLDEAKFSKNVDRFLAYGEFLNKKMKDIKDKKKKKMLDDTKNYVKNIFKKDKKTKNKLKFEDIKHYITMISIPVLSIVIYNIVKPLAYGIGLSTSGLGVSFLLGTLAIDGYKHLKYSFKKKQEAKKEEELASKIAELIFKTKSKEKDDLELDFAFEDDYDETLEVDEYEFDDFLLEKEQEKDNFDDEEFDDFLEIQNNKVVDDEKEEDNYDDFLEKKEVSSKKIDNKKEEFLPLGCFDDTLYEEDFFETISNDKKEDDYNDFFETKEVVDEKKDNKKEDDEFDDFFRIKNSEIIDTDNEELESFSFNDSEYEEEKEEKIESENVQINENNRELLTLKTIKKEIERTKYLKEELEKQLTVKNNIIQEIKLGSGGKKHNELLKNNLEYAKVYKEKTRVEKLYKEAVKVFNDSLVTYYLISNGEEITVEDYFSKLKGNSSVKK